MFILSLQIIKDKVVDIVNNCAISLMPFKKDAFTDASFPIKIIEYTALGKVVVSSNLSEVGLLQFPNIVFYDDHKGTEELSNCIVQAFDLNIDINKTRDLVLKYTWNDIAGQLQKIIDDVINAKREQD